MKYLTILALAFVLCSCDPTDEQKAKVTSKLPQGCKITDLGSYGDYDNLVVVTCDGNASSTINAEWHVNCGKAQCSKYGVIVTKQFKA